MFINYAFCFKKLSDYIVIDYMYIHCKICPTKNYESQQSHWKVSGMKLKANMIRPPTLHWFHMSQFRCFFFSFRFLFFSFSFLFSSLLFFHFSFLSLQVSDREQTLIDWDQTPLIPTIFFSSQFRHRTLQPINRQAERPTNQPTGRPTNQPTGRPTNQPTRQPPDQ